jgi:hypothetical protein
MAELLRIADSIDALKTRALQAVSIPAEKLLLKRYDPTDVSW